MGAVVGGVRDDAADHLEESFAQLGCRRDVVQLTHLSTTADMTQACVNSSRDNLRATTPRGQHHDNSSRRASITIQQELGQPSRTSTSMMTF